MPRPGWPPVLICALLAGCGQAPSASPEPPGAPEAPLQAFSTSVDHAGCTGAELFLPVSEAQAAPYLPAGFSLADPGLAILAVYTCPSGERAFLALGVDPPPELVSPQANHFWAAQHLLGANTTLGQAFAQARANVSLAEIEVDSDLASLRFTVLAGQTAYRFEGDTVVIHGSDAVAPVLPTFREYVPAHGGVAFVDAGFAGGGGALVPVAGTLRTAGDDATADLFGPMSQVRGLVATDYEYADARIGFVPWP